MKFSIVSAKYRHASSIAKAYAILSKYCEKFVEHQVSWYGDYAVIELNSLEEMLSLSKNLGKRLIVEEYDEDEYGGLPSIIIYDDYIE